MPCRFRYECLFRRKIDRVNLRHEPCCTPARRIRKLYPKTFITENLDKAASPIICCLSVLFMIFHVLGTPQDQSRNWKCQSHNKLPKTCTRHPKIKVTIPNHISISKLAHPHPTQQISKSTKLANRQLKQFRKYTKLANPHSTKLQL